jgi:glycogen debranching enzyme
MFVAMPDPKAEAASHSDTGSERAQPSAQVPSSGTSDGQRTQAKESGEGAAQHSSNRERRLLQHGRSTLVQPAGPSLVVKCGALFALSAHDGDMDESGHDAYGLYFHDTRFLTRARLRLNGCHLSVLLSSDEKGSESVTELTNPELQLSKDIVVLKETIAVRRVRRLSTEVVEEVRLTNFSSQDLDVDLELGYGADFQNMFVVRGADPGKRGKVHDPKWDGGHLLFRYDDADGRTRETRISSHPAPDSHDGGDMHYKLTLHSRKSVDIKLRIAVSDKGSGDLETKPNANAEKALSFNPVQVQTDNALFNEVLKKSFDDLRMLITREHGDTYFAAGVPWYVALFGRDSLITALQVLSFDPGVAATTLRVLARYQGTKYDEWRDEEPGKILHELRVGEKANLGEVPQTPYYGTVDATPLFIILLAEHLRWTGDSSVWNDLKSNVERALKWMDECGDHDGDGFLDYQATSSKGLTNQGWKDSGNSITNQDGSLVKPPVALVEVQGYVYRARLEAAWLFEQDGDQDRAEKLRGQAEDLRKRFEDAYWMSDRRSLAVAIQKDGKPAKSLTSNAGQALWSGVVSQQHAEAVAKTLMNEAMYSGWGVRTLAQGEAAYNPIDYQVGSIWPHDNSFIAAGLKRYGQDNDFVRVFSGIFDAAVRFEHYRLPEVFAGFGRDQYANPVHYPVACSPQAWASGAIPYLLRTALGLEPDAPNGCLTIRRPILPDWLGSVEVKGLQVGKSSLDLRYERVNGVTLVALVHREGDAQVLIEY